MFAIRRTFNRLGERPKLCPMEEPKVKLAVFNHGEVPTTRSGKEQGEIYACSIWDPHLKKDIDHWDCHHVSNSLAPLNFVSPVNI